MNFVKKTLLLCLLTTGLHAQVNEDYGKIYYQLNYRPGDWITIGSTQFATSVASGPNIAYIGTLGGIVRYESNTNKFLYPLTTSNGLLDNGVFFVALDPQTQLLWVATRKGVQCYDPFSERFTQGQPVPEGVTGFAFDNGQILIQAGKTTYITSNTLGFLKEFTPPENREIKWNLLKPLKPGTIPHVFISAQTGFNYSDYESSFVDQDFRKFPVTGFSTDRFGRSWVTTAGAGTWMAPTQGSLHSPVWYGLGGWSVRAMVFDEMNMWIGAASDQVFENSSELPAGLTQWNQDIDIFQYYPTSFRLGLKADHVNALTADSQYIWAGTRDGLYQFNKRMQQWYAYGAGSGLYNVNVLAVAAYSSKILIGTEQGLNIGLPAKKGFVIYKSDIPELWNTAILRIHPTNTDIWLGTSNGIYQLDPDLKLKAHYNAVGFEVSPAGMVNQSVRGIAETSSSLFFASDWDVLEFTKATAVWNSIPVNSAFLQPGVNDAVYDSGNLWLATQSGVLRYILAKKKWIFYSVPDGLAGEVVTSILPDGDYVWFGTNCGLTQFHWNAEYLRE